MTGLRILQSASCTLCPLLYQSCTAIEMGNTKGKGGFGEVFECVALDGNAPPDALVVKILGETSDAGARKGHATTGELLTRVNQADLARSQRGDPPLASEPGLLGLPLLQFEGEMNGKQVYGHLMNRLDAHGYLPLESLTDGSNPAERKRYLSSPIEDRLEIAASLMATAHILIEELAFAHCDLNEPNLYLNIKTRQCALIDYDGGLLLGTGERPATYGKMGEWLAPEIMEEINKPAGDPIGKVSRESEYWTLMVAASYLLFLTYPLFFLQTLSKRKIEAYLNQYRWPAMSAADANWNVDNAPCYKWFEQKIKDVPAHIVEMFDEVLRNGLTHPDKRLTPQDWLLALRGAGQQPEIYVFISDAEIYAQGMEVRLKWWTKGASAVTISPDFGQIAATGEAAFTAQRSVTYRLQASNRYGMTEATLTVKVLKLPQIREIVVPTPMKILPTGFVSSISPAFSALNLSGALTDGVTERIAGVTNRLEEVIFSLSQQMEHMTAHIIEEVRKTT